MILIMFNYDEDNSEAKPRFSIDYNEMDSTIKMDILNDAIFYLSEERNKLHDLMYKQRGKNDKHNK